LDYADFRPVVLENEILRLVVFPELGAKIYDLVYKPINQNILWHNPAVKPCKVSPNSPFDDVWCGGWDEILPNDAPCVVAEKHYPDMGDVWSIPWNYSLTHDQNSVTLRTSVTSPLTSCMLTRLLTIRDGHHRVELRYMLKNVGREPVQVLWKLHPAFAINETCSIEIPARTGIVDPRYRYLYSESSSTYEWPNAIDIEGRQIDVSRVPSITVGTCVLHYVTDLQDGIVKFRNPRSNTIVTIRFPKDIFNNVWLFLAYGGYRSLYTAVIEPSTSYPYDLGQAIQEGHSAHLDPDQEIDCAVEVELHTLDE
jgi:hypothetical protein